MADLAAAQLALMNSRAYGDPRRIGIAEQRLSQCTLRLRQVAVVLDRVLVERGGDGCGRLVEGAVRLTETV